MAFRGHYSHTLDAKNRLTVPSRFRAALSSGVILARGFEPCIAVWTPEGWKDFTDRVLAPHSPLSEQARKLSRFLNASSFDAEMDAAGRLMLPAPLVEHARIEREVAVIGNNASFEIWDAAMWTTYDRQLRDSIQDDAQSLAFPG